MEKSNGDNVSNATGAGRRGVTIVAYESEKDLLEGMKNPPTKYHRPYAVIVPAAIYEAMIDLVTESGGSAAPSIAKGATQNDDGSVSFFFSAITTEKAIAYVGEKLLGIRCDIAGGRKIRAKSAADVDVDAMSEADRRALLAKLLPAGSTIPAPAGAQLTIDDLAKSGSPAAAAGAAAAAAADFDAGSGPKPADVTPIKLDPEKDPKTSSGERPSEAAVRRSRDRRKTPAKASA